MKKDVAVLKQMIEKGETYLGIELGSTRIKAVLIDIDNEIIASGSHEWCSNHIDDIWTYSLEDIWSGLQSSFLALKTDVKNQYDTILSSTGTIGISAMMHGYMVFDKNDQQLVPYRTWRNNNTMVASSRLTELLDYPIPLRWSVAHLYHSIINNEDHVNNIDYITTLAGYIHWKLTGEKVLGVGDASGMFPIDINSKKFDEKKIRIFNEQVKNSDLSWQLQEILPEVLTAGDSGGELTVEGAKLLDPSGEFCGCIPFCPPEGDAGTGMVATNSISERTGNISAGTSVFAMIILEKELSKVYSEIDLVYTPNGKLVAMVHSNNCTTELNAWVNLFGEALDSFGCKVDESTLFGTLYAKALEGDADCGGLLSYGYHSGEHITHFEEGRPLFVRRNDSAFNLSNFIRTHLYSSIGALKLGLNILLKEEKVALDSMLGHGGLFKTEVVGQKIIADAMNTPISVMNTAGEGGAWGIALLASYRINAKELQSLDDYLDQEVFSHYEKKVAQPTPEDVIGFEKYMERYIAGLEIERAAVNNLK
ncbi:MAG: FGGY-family carbohydrate kinase [Vallitaleaceae bacterium]|jgi:sugar (pentulose or hexulose) kinase|nr:FGGY-family carbohydrate kinase [Vallitaleaceae bacterium]